MPLTGQLTARPRLLSTLCAAVVAALVLLPLLGHKLLAEWDEAIYAEVSREMLSTSWLTPHWNGLPWLEKPPLTLWITAALFKLFGVSEFCARAGSALSAIGLVALLHAFLARTRDLLAAWLGTIVLLATFGFLHIAHVGEMDTLLSLAAMLSLIGLCLVEERNDNGWYLFWTGFAIALMTKGAAAVTLPLTAIVFSINRRVRLRKPFALGALLFLAAVLPWHLAMFHRFGNEFLAQYLGLHVLARATHQIEGHHTRGWYYLVVLVVSSPPFCLLFPAALLRGLRNPDLRPWAIFAAVQILFFTCIQTRLPHYIAPAYPALAVLTAIWLADWIRPRRSRPRSFRVRTALAAATIWTLSVLATHSTLKRLHSAALAAPGLLDNREADVLLRSVHLHDLQTLQPSGPLLVWRHSPVQSIATLVFYSGREVLLVDPDPVAAPNPTRYQPTPQPLACPAPRCLLLLDTTNIPRLPPDLHFESIAQSPTLTVGSFRASLIPVSPR